MHEMSMVRVVVEAVLEECEGKDVKRVKAINLRIGEMRDVIEAYVPDLFRFLARGTIAEEAEVRIERIPMRVRCRECGEIWRLNSRDESTWTCPRCGTYKHYTLFSGSEFIIDSIEVEGPSSLEGDPNLVVT